MLDTDYSYYQHRAEAEVERAAQATHPKAVAAHYHLANAYLERVDAGKSEQQAGHD